MNTIINNQFVCECCGTTTPLFDEEITVTLIGNNGVIQKKVCYECAEKIKKNDPRYLNKSVRSLDPEMQEIEELRKQRWEEKNEYWKNKFLTTTKNAKLTKVTVGTRHYEGVVDVIDPCYGADTLCGMRFPIATGEYTCAAWNMTYQNTDIKENFEVDDLEIVGVYLNGKIPTHDEMIKVGVIGADSGLFGIFDVKENLDLAAWLEAKLQAKDDFGRFSIQDIGFVSSWGDIDMKVYVAINNGEVVAVELRMCDYIPRGQ